MPSDTKNIHIGVGRISFKGADLGYTKGGIELSVETETVPVTVDQFGETVVKENIKGRKVEISVPMAETTYANIAATLPGSTLVLAGGTAATGSIQMSSALAEGDTVTFGDEVFTFVAASSNENEVTFDAGGATANAVALAAAAAAHSSTELAKVTFSQAGSTITLLYGTFGVAGNGFNISSSIANNTVTPMSGGVDPQGGVKIDTGIGVDLLDTAGELIIHPIDRADDDKSFDVVVPIANTPGGMEWAYKTDDIRVLSTKFMAYPDTDGLLMLIGDAEVIQAG